jgi:hypothetical protein
MVRIPPGFVKIDGGVPVPRVTTIDLFADIAAVLCLRRGEDAHALPENLYIPYDSSGRAAASLPRRARKGVRTLLQNECSA